MALLPDRQSKLVGWQCMKGRSTCGGLLRSRRRCPGCCRMTPHHSVSSEWLTPSPQSTTTTTSSGLAFTLRHAKAVRRLLAILSRFSATRGVAVLVHPKTLGTRWRRIPGPKGAEATAAVSSGGAAIAAVLHWLSELRARDDWRAQQLPPAAATAKGLVGAGALGEPRRTLTPQPLSAPPMPFRCGPGPLFVAGQQSLSAPPQLFAEERRAGAALQPRLLPGGERPACATLVLLQAKPGRVSDDIGEAIGALLTGMDAPCRVSVSAQVGQEECQISV
jgi:hypothetical protein